MDPQMQQKCDSKLQELQECMPFLLRVLEKLRNHNRNDPARQTQLDKIQKLYNLLNDQSQKFKWDLLVKCESVVKKLQRKMELQGETELIKTTTLEGSSPVTKNSANTLKREDCPESPPPQQRMEYCDNVQPVVIPTERRCSPPISNKHRENCEPDREHNRERKDRKHSHTHQHHHHHHHQHSQQQRNKQNESSMRDNSLSKRNSFNAHDNPMSITDEREQHAIIDRYLSAQRQRVEENRQSCWQRRSQNQEVYTTKNWAEKHTASTTNSSTNNFNTSRNLSPTVQQQHTSVFSRLGEKMLDCDSDSNANMQPFENFHNKNESEHSNLNTIKTSNSFHTIPKQPILTVKETPPIVPDFLKSPPLTANDITQLLNESNSNSNSNSGDTLSISEIGTRRYVSATSTTTKPTTKTTTNVDTNSRLDMVRKKFALLTKADTSGVSSPKSNENSSFSRSPISPELTNTKPTILQNWQKQTTPPTTPTERVALKYHPHPRSTSTTNKPSSTSIVPNTNVNVIPTVHLNDPRLRKSNTISNVNGNVPTLPPNNNHIPSLISRQVIPPTISKPRHLMSPSSNASATPSTPSPIYGNMPSNARPSPTQATPVITNNQTKIKDPRLQHSRTSSNLHTSPMQTRPLLVTGDSSDENWDLDDNAPVFPQPRPFPNRNPPTSITMPTYNVNAQTNKQRFGNTQMNASLPPWRQSASSWDSGFQATNANLYGSLENVGGSKSFTNMNWHPASPASSTTSLHYNANSFKNSANDRFNALQNNAPIQFMTYAAPRTYGAYKEAKARAKAEADARKTAEEDITRNATIETEPKTSESSEVTTKPSGSGSVSLDTTYRNTNFKNCEPPKIIENFKIPKKTAVVMSSTGKEEKSPCSDIEKLNTETLKQVEDIEPSKPEKIKSHKEISAPKKEVPEELEKLSLDSKTTAIKVQNINSLPPKSQRVRFSKKEKDHDQKSNPRRGNSKLSPTKIGTIESDKKTPPVSFESAEWHIIDEVGSSNSEKELTEASNKKIEMPKTSSKFEFKPTQPARILRRRCTMIEKTSTPEVDKEKLFKGNAMLFEDLQERERKINTEAAANKAHAQNRRHGEICYEKTDDGCTVSTQNIITGKRRTRTTANFNEVQQGIAVFKHIKSSELKKDTTATTVTRATATATTSTNVQPIKERKKPGPKPKPKTELEQEKAKTTKDKDKQLEAGASRIKKRRKTLVDTEEISEAKAIRKEDEKVQGTEKSSETLPNVTSIFDTFIQKILHPGTNADELINKLRDILSEQEVAALFSVREAMMKKHLAGQCTNETNKDVATAEHKSTSAVVPDDHDDDGDKDSDDDKIICFDDSVEKSPAACVPSSTQTKQTTSQTETPNIKPKAARRNELDRLHEDIRDMFISEGVLTATGKRMCTFVEPCPPTKTTESEQHKISTESNEKACSSTLTTPSKNPSESLVKPRLRKTRVLLPTIRTTMRRSLRKSQANHDSREEEKDEKQDEEVVDDELIDGNAPSCSDNSFSSDICSSSTPATVTTDTTTTTSSSNITISDNEPLRRMPILKPVKPIRLREEDELEEWLSKRKDLIVSAPKNPKSEKVKPKRYKPCPKSKKPPEALINDDEEDDIEGVAVEDSAINAEIISEVSQIKTELLDISVPYKDDNENIKDTEVPLKNTNPKWHWASRYGHKCVVCKQKAGYLSTHYKRYHKENYVSRLAPIILQQLKQPVTTLNKPVLKKCNKNCSTLWLHRCPFCLQFRHTSLIGWLEHFITHTGEYIYECTLCNKSFNKSIMVERHMKAKCEGLGGRYFHNDEVNKSYKNNTITAHVCHLCNFLRLGRSSLEQHYINQHDYDVKSINGNLGYSITLINAEDVPTAKTLEELMQMEIKLNRQYQTDVISLVDDTVNDSPVIDNSTNEKIIAIVSANTVQVKSITKKKALVLLTTKEGSAVEASMSKEIANKSQTTLAGENTSVNISVCASIPNQANSQSLNDETPNATKEVTFTTALSTPLSSVFLSTTDDSNDGETPTILARKLLTADDETDLCNKNSPKPKLTGTISIAERLSQRLREAEAITANSSTKQFLKVADTSIQQQQKNIQNTTEVTPLKQTIQTPFKQSEVNPLKLTKEPKTPEITKEAAAMETNDKMDEEGVNLIAEETDEDDDDWEDIEVVETTTTQVNKETKIQKNKINPLQSFSRFYATMSPSSKLHKKSKGFKPLMTIFSGINVGKDSNKMAGETLKTTVNSKENSTSSSTIITITTSSDQLPTSTTIATTSSASSSSVQPSTTIATTSSVSSPCVQPTTPQVSAFRPMIANLADFLPNSPCNDPLEIETELVPSSPLQDLNDITTFLGSNLSGLMDIDVEDPANSVCIHNTDNQQTSIKEALDFVAAQAVSYDEAQTLSKQSNSNILSDNCLMTLAPMSMNRIQNIGFTCSTSIETAQSNTPTFRFYCFSDRCTFMYSSEIIGLENHFLLEHPQLKWNGYCNTCACQTKVGTFSSELNFSEEFNHLLEVHIKELNSTTQSSADIDATTALQNETNSSSSSEQPRIKLRRLSGDCLSTTTLQSDSPNSSNFLDNYDESTSFSDLIRFNPRVPPKQSTTSDQLTETVVPTSVEPIIDDVPYFTNVSKDFQITSISSGLEPTELSAIVKSALNAKTPSKIADTTNSCALQISNVISLGENSSTNLSSTYLPPATAAVTSVAEATSELLLPKISNVCSLNSNISSASRNVGQLLPQQISQEHVELTHSAAESWEVSNILANATRNTNQTRPSQNRINNDSPGPLIVSETLPTAQATSGNFVITQTVSAQYADESLGGNTTKTPKLGFNISISSAAMANAIAINTKTPSPTTSICAESREIISKATSVLKPMLNCMEPTCKYTTRHLVAIIDHVKWHEKINDVTQHEYLRCSLCKQKYLTVEAYTQHLRSEHYSSGVNPTSSVADSASNDMSYTTSMAIESCALTEKIRNILTQNQVEITAKEGPISSRNSLTAKKSIDSENGRQNLNDESVSFKAQLLESIKEMVSKTGISENKLYRCVVKECNVKLNESSYHTHVLYHLSTYGGPKDAFCCHHCKWKGQNISVLKTHFKVHGRHTIFCYICMDTAGTNMSMARHFAQKHYHKKELHTSIIAQWESHEGAPPLVYYVTSVNPLTDNDTQDYSKKLIVEWQRKKASTRTHFNPNEIELLPIQAIFSKDIFCALCLYKTKVRTNMVRHMLQHKNTTTAGLDSCIAGPVGVMNLGQQNGNANENSGNMIVCSMDPVNPVPCLISNEKHFDRMTNLASSSLGPIVPQGGANSTSTSGNDSTITSSAICKLRYNYIPQSKRFKCGVSGCEYLTIYEDIFRSHLHALHSDVRSYQCLFCKEELCKRSLVEERIVQHLRFHDRTLYQCELCDHSHYIRHVVERHALEKHAPLARVNILMFIRDEEGSLEGTRKVLGTYAKKRKDSNTNTGGNSDGLQNDGNGVSTENNIALNAKTSATSSAKAAQKIPKFICDLCQHTTVTYNQLISHSNSQHGIKQPYQCSYCLHFTAWSEQNVKTHIAEEHPGEMFKVKRIFGKMNAAQQLKAKKEFLRQMEQSNVNEPPLKPLWQRDDPKRARQIRGIPMEDEEESERLRKRLRLSDDYDEEYDEDFEENTSGNPIGHSVSNLYLNRFEFGCFHCEYKANSIDDLKTMHWENSHNSGNVATSKPFLFRLLMRLKCAECQNFTGCFWELQKHMTADHAKPTSHAADPRAKKLVCGYCEYECSNATQLLRHHLRDDHQPQDVKGIFSLQMAKVMRLECSKPTLYVHCTLCSELFNSRLAVVQHAGEKHVHDTEHFSFRELTNSTIYRCAECVYSSTDELTTLRHMINHYRRFKRCNFCNQPQISFNDYMQHCYSDHRSEIRRFSEIYPLSNIKKFLMQVLIIFPNGWIINKKNLCNTPYGNEERIKTLYVEICKTSQEPPIPRLSLGRLVARKSIEAKQQQSELMSSTSTAAVMQSSGNAVADVTKKQMPAQKITKRRSTIAVGNDDADYFGRRQVASKKQKLSTNIVTNRTASVPLPPKFKAATETVNISKSAVRDAPYSFYGQRPEKNDWSKLHTKISLAGINAEVSLDKFKTLVKIDAHVVLEKLDITKYKLPRSVNNNSQANESVLSEGGGLNSLQNMNQYPNVKKACPASQKYRFI